MSKDPEQPQPFVEDHESKYQQIFHGESELHPDVNVQKARDALKLIGRVRDATKKETARGEKTINDGAVERSSDPDKLDRHPQHIGRFQIIKSVGKGGFGMVFLAFDPNLQREVALKVPRFEAITTPDLTARFLHEGRAVAALCHPNIVPVYESGQSGSICYLASQFVQGVSLDQWIELESSVSPIQSATICQSIAEGVAHAHQRGVLHRDIKPANILVASPKPDLTANIANRILITDFGLAKNIHDDSNQTQPGALIGTPCFMSPEQAKQKDATEQSDIYSIGAVLYFLLSRQPPFHGTTIIETIQNVVGENPIPPSRFDSGIPKDLEAVCLKCLDKDPRSRYQSAFELQADLGRFLRGEPVLARKTNWLSHSAKWIRRNPQVTGTIALITSILIGSILWINSERQHALGEANRANQAAKRSNDILKFFVQSFEGINLQSGGSAELTAKDVVLRAKNSLDESDLDEIGRGLLLTTVSDCLIELSEYELAIEAAQTAHEMLSEALGPEHPDSVAAQFNHAVAVRWSGEVEEALPIYQGVLQVRLESLGPDDMLVIDTLGALAAAYHEIGEPRSSLEMFQKVYESRCRVLGIQHQDTLSTLMNLGVIQQQLGRIDESEKIARKIVDAQLASLGPDHPKTLSSMSHLAKMLVQKEEYSSSLELQHRIYQIRTRVLGADHLDTLTTQYEIARIEGTLGHFEEAIERIRNTIDGFETNAGPEKYETLVSLAAMARIYQKMNRHAEAIPIFRKIVTIRTKTKGAKHRLTLGSLRQLGQSLSLAGNQQEAISTLQDTLVEQTETLGEDDRRTLLTQADLAWAQAEAGRLEEALDSIQSAVDCWDDDQFGSHPEFLAQLLTLGKVQLLNQDDAEAGRVFRQYLNALGEDYPNRWKIGQVKSLLGEAMAGSDDLNDAYRLLVEGYEELTSEAGEVFDLPRDRQSIVQGTIHQLIACSKKRGDRESLERWESEAHHQD